MNELEKVEGIMLAVSGIYKGKKVITFESAKTLAKDHANQAVKEALEGFVKELVDIFPVGDTAAIKIFNFYQNDLNAKIDQELKERE